MNSYNNIKGEIKENIILLFKDINNIVYKFNNKSSWNLKSENKNSNCILTPWYITGISDGEGSFQITIQDIKGKGKTGYKPFLEFKITQKNHSIKTLGLNLLCNKLEDKSKVRFI